jgi:hypothetical protein
MLSVVVCVSVAARTGSETASRAMCKRLPCSKPELRRRERGEAWADGRADDGRERLVPFAVFTSRKAEEARPVWVSAVWLDRRDFVGSAGWGSETHKACAPVSAWFEAESSCACDDRCAEDPRRVVAMSDTLPREAERAEENNP